MPFPSFNKTDVFNILRKYNDLIDNLIDTNMLLFNNNNIFYN